MSSKMLLIGVIFVSLTACSTMNAVRLDGQTPGETLTAGDHLIIHEHSGRRTDMRLISIHGKQLHGRSSEQPFPLVTIDMDEIKSVEREQINRFTTNLAVALGTVIVVPLAVLAGTSGIDPYPH